MENMDQSLKQWRSLKKSIKCDPADRSIKIKSVFNMPKTEIKRGQTETMLVKHVIV